MLDVVDTVVVVVVVVAVVVAVAVVSELQNWNRLKDSCSHRHSEA